MTMKTVMEMIEDALTEALRTAHPRAVRELCTRIAEAEMTKSGKDAHAQPMFRRLVRAARLVGNEMTLHEQRLTLESPPVITVEVKKANGGKRNV
jgi:hypothetical protein